MPSIARRALPDSATDIQEYYSDGGFTGDFARVLKARLPEKDFPLYAKNFGLSEKYDPIKYGSTYDQLKTGVGSVPDWWDEPTDLGNCYFLHTPGKEFFERIKWKDGWVYFVAVAWYTIDRTRSCWLCGSGLSVAPPFVRSASLALPAIELLRPLLTSAVPSPASRSVKSRSCGTHGGSPGVIPCCFLRVTVGATKRAILITGGLPVVLHPRPCTPCLYPLLCSISRRIRLRLLLRSLHRDTVAFGYPSPLSNWGRTCFLDFVQLSARLDPMKKIGTLAERTCKQPGVPGTHPSARGYGSQARRSSALTLA